LFQDLNLNPELNSKSIQTPNLPQNPIKGWLKTKEVKWPHVWGRVLEGGTKMDK
jgi:hypothetical protein